MRFTVPAILTAALLAGCSSQPSGPRYVRMKDNAPAFGTGSLTTMQAFMVGTWTTRGAEMDPNMAKQLGVESIANQEDEADGELYETFEFNPDGTLVYTEKAFKVKGKWTVNGEFVSMTYDTVNGKDFQTMQTEVSQHENGGTQAGIGEGLAFEALQKSLSKYVTVTLGPSKKTLVFTTGATAANPMDGFTSGVAGGLERLKDNKKDSS